MLSEKHENRLQSVLKSRKSQVLGMLRTASCFVREDKMVLPEDLDAETRSQQDDQHRVAPPITNAKKTSV